MNQKLLRLKPMAEDLDVSQRTMHYLVSIGCPCIQVRKLLWFDREKVFAWLEKYERKTKRVPKLKELEVAK